jgi:hypothetical protein
MNSVYTNIARKRIEQSQEASQNPSKINVPQSKVTPKSDSQLSNKDVSLRSESKKPEIMNSRNHEDDSPTDIPIKYSTLIRTHFLKKIKIHAAETDLKDYEVIELALTEFFKKH